LGVLEGGIEKSLTNLLIIADSRKGGRKTLERVLGQRGRRLSRDRIGGGPNESRDYPQGARGPPPPKKDLQVARETF